MIFSDNFAHLLDGGEKEILHMSSDLPSQGQVLRYLHYIHKVKQLPIRTSAKMAVRNCAKIWNSFGIPTGDELDAVSDLEFLYREYRHYLKNPNADDQMWFTGRMKCLFDISARNALDVISDHKVKSYFCYKLDVDHLHQLNCV